LTWKRPPLLQIIEPTSRSQIDEVRKLFLEYWHWLGFAPCFQDFDREWDSLPGPYAPPDGCLLTALYDSKLAGCVALRRLEGDICEMKRLYVRSAFRGKRIGFALASAIIEEARKRQYKSMRLDTLPIMEKAIAIYKSLKFEEIDAYTKEPIDEAKYMELKL
jgi:ribosomal protein S18 acetylase RimI-like enzyme